MYMLVSTKRWGTTNFSIKRDQHFLRIAEVISERSKCLRARYGSVIVSGNTHRIVSTGYNGKPKGSINDDVCYREGYLANEIGNLCCIHSEMNAILFSDPADRIGGTIYVSGVPCRDCMLNILQSGLTSVVYIYDPYSDHLGNSDLDFVEMYGINIDIRIYVNTYEGFIDNSLRKLLQPQTQILYIPHHADMDLNHPDVEPGFIDHIIKDQVFARYWYKETMSNLDRLELRTKSNCENTPHTNIVIMPSVPQEMVDLFFTDGVFNEL